MDNARKRSSLKLHFLKIYDSTEKNSPVLIFLQVCRKLTQDSNSNVSISCKIVEILVVHYLGVKFVYHFVETLQSNYNYQLHTRSHVTRSQKLHHIHATNPDTQNEIFKHIQSCFAIMIFLHHCLSCYNMTFRKLLKVTVINVCNSYVNNL